MGMDIWEEDPNNPENQIMGERYVDYLIRKQIEKRQKAEVVEEKIFNFSAHYVLPIILAMVAALFA